jgi:hypothetical protein
LGGGVGHAIHLVVQPTIKSTQLSTYFESSIFKPDSITSCDPIR